MTNTPRIPEDDAQSVAPAREDIIESLRKKFAGLDASENQTMTEDRFMELAELSGEERRARTSPEELAEFDELDQASQRFTELLDRRQAQYEANAEAAASTRLENHRDLLAHEARVKMAPVRSNELLTEVAHILASVEASNRNTERVLVEIKEHREVAAEQQRKQNQINVLLSIAAVLASVGSIVVPLVTSR